MTRRELLIRMAKGESLKSSTKNKVFLLGKDVYPRNLVRPDFVSMLIEDGLAQRVEDPEAVQIVLTSKVDDWFRKRGINFNPLVNR